MTQEINVWNQFGEAFSEGGAGAFKAPWTPPDDGSIEVAVLTQMGDLAGDPEGWVRGHKRHWGFAIRRKDDPTKTSKITVQCLERRGKGGIILEEDALDTKYEVQEQAMKDYEVQLRRENKSDEEIKNLLQPLKGWLRSFSRENKAWMFGMNLSSEFNRIRLSWRTLGDLRKEMNKIQEELKINPRSPRNLVFFKITRTGSAKGSLGSMTEKVERSRESVIVGGQAYEKLRMVALTDEQAHAAIKEYQSLNDVGTYAATHEQLRQLAECSGDPEEVERILGIGDRGNSPAQPVSVAVPASVSTSPVAPARQVVPEVVMPTANEIKTQAPPVEDDEEAAAMAALEAARKRKAQKALDAVKAAEASKATTPPPPAAAPLAPASPAAFIAGASEQDLLARLGLSAQDLGRKPAA